MRHRMPQVLNGALASSAVLGSSRAHATLNRPTASVLRLSVCGSGDDHHALVLRSRIENLVRCGLRDLVIDAGALDDASDMFIRVLADAIISARDQGCVVSAVGLDATDVLEALYRAPLSQLVTIYGSRPPRCRTGRPTSFVTG